jgi:hypothetical protein
MYLIMSAVPLINNRKELRAVCSSVISNTQDQEELDHRKKLKTYLIESNISHVSSDSVKGFGIENTEDSSLKILKAKLNEKTVLKFYLDVDDSRFWKLHSLYDSSITERIITQLVMQNHSKLDFVWMCSTLLEKYMRYGKNTGFGIKFKNAFIKKDNDEIMKDVSMRFWGGGAKEVVDDLRNNPRLKQGINLSAIGLNHQIEGGFAKENISNFGRFTVMKGDSVDSHFNIVQKIKTDYSSTLNLIEEKYRMKTDKKENGFKLSGSPIYIDFKTPIEDVDAFVDKMVSSTNPFRLSGVKRKVDNNFHRVFGIDLHTNDLVNLEVTPNWMSIYLSSTSCGNVVTRLLTNIQTHLTSQVELKGEDNERII